MVRESKPERLWLLTNRLRRIELQAEFSEHQLRATQPFDQQLVVLCCPLAEISAVPSMQPLAHL